MKTMVLAQKIRTVRQLKGLPVVFARKVIRFNKGAMGKLIAQVVLHANGAFGPGGGERPTGDDWEDHVVSLLNTCDAILLGRKTYELLGGYWPNDGLLEARRLAEPLNAIRKYVVSSTLVAPAWEPVTVIAGAPFDRIRALKGELAGNLITYGSSELVAALAHRSLVDQFHVVVAPLMTGQLPPFCAALPGSIELDLQEVKHFAGQRIFLRYAVARK
jgi:dihydrofolate reductase